MSEGFSEANLNWDWIYQVVQLSSEDDPRNSPIFNLIFRNSFTGFMNKSILFGDDSSIVDIWATVEEAKGYSLSLVEKADVRFQQINKSGSENTQSYQ